MLEGIPDDNQEILNQLHSDVFLQRMKDHLDGGTNLNENDASDLNETVRRLLVQDASPSIDTEDIQRLLKDDDISQAIASLIKSQNKET
ncbi:MAG: hypothetical protein CME33_15435 [Gimesia sp.]|uniref:hypothetical protein n=1 Tax=Gimesia sp. TaxID=2024833 RepID=UPI000C438E1D|nr:hypothetical protein [Gimesia sp.]MAX37947.1 hypothetical protein [Gimesia sp.]|tara:strand:+ start:414 stop:680 length:267 start_codon:yes stop_codon:yes gene_type:complete